MSCRLTPNSNIDSVCTNGWVLKVNSQEAAGADGGMSKISVTFENLTEQTRNTQNILCADSIEFQKDLCGKTSVICGGEPE